ncbi:MAG: hypothetical protein PHR96_04970 [Clostridia bacterium]|jgi:hypothetical protein|nr:hypothetical protein [Clostridia bacterium]
MIDMKISYDEALMIYYSICVTLGNELKKPKDNRSLCSLQIDELKKLKWQFGTTEDYEDYIKEISKIEENKICNNIPFSEKVYTEAVVNNLLLINKILNEQNQEFKSICNGFKDIFKSYMIFLGRKSGKNQMALKIEDLIRRINEVLEGE